MERNYGSEIDAMREELKEIKEQMASVQALLTASAADLKELGVGSRNRTYFDREFVGHVKKTNKAQSDERVRGLMADCEEKCGQDGDTGCVTYLGVFASGGNQANWVRKDVSGNALLDLADNGVAEKVLACVGSQEKLNILAALLRKPSTVAQLVEKLGFGSTGQVYHHLKPLLAAGLVREISVPHKGWYEVVPHRVQGLVMILCGIADLVDGRYAAADFVMEKTEE